MLDDSMNPFKVFCDFDSKTNATWTLVQSYQFRYYNKFRTPYFQNSPVNEETPCWDEYRLSKSRMQSIQDDFVKFRITCKYDTDGVVYTDYLQAAKKQIDILTYQIEYSYQWQIRGLYKRSGTKLFKMHRCYTIRQSRNTV
mgnify:CR=1 FL=1